MSPQEGFVSTNGVRLQYLDWGGPGRALIFIHGMMDNPHAFADLAPAFADRFRVISYARRGHGASDVRGPYDSETLTEDMKGLMDALGIQRADLVGWSMGGNELTGMANRYPERVRSLIYFDGAYDTSDPDFAKLLAAVPAEMFATPPEALVSFAAYRDYMGAEHYRGVADKGRLDSYLRETVVVHPDGHLEARMSKELTAELYAALGTDKPRDYTRIRCPVLAFFPESQVDTRNPALLELENQYMRPFREKSMAQLRREMPQVEIIVVPGTHQCFFMTSRERVAREMLRFLK